LLEGGPHSYTRELLLAGFAVNGSELTAEHTEALSTLVSYMSEAPVAEYGILSVIGRASQTGSETNNQQLSLARANAAALFLRAQGVPADHIGTVKGYGSQVPLTNQPGIEAAANRSVVLTFVFVVDQEQGVAPTPTTGGSRHWGLSVTLAGGAGHVGIGGGFFVGRLKNIDSGAIRTITFAGAGVGVGLSTPGATPDLSFEEFTTGAPYVMDDFKGQLAVMTGMSGGFMVGYGAARFSIPFMGVDVLLTGLNYGQVGWDASANVGTILFP